MKHWIQAARLRTLPLSVSGIIVGSAYAVYQHTYNSMIFIGAIVTTLLFQILSNFANDYGDGIKGTDANRTGEKRLVAAGVITAGQMKKAVVLMAVLSLLSALVLIYISFGKDNFLYSVLFAVLGIASIAAAIKYTVGKNAYGYSGLGDLFVFLFFGWVSVVGANFLFSKTTDWVVWLPATAVGFLSIAVLNLNNMRDIHNDKVAGKYTLVVKLGLEKAKYYHYFLIVSSGLLFLIAEILMGKYPVAGVFCLFLFLKHLVFVKNTNEPGTLDSQLKIVALGTFFVSLLFLLNVVFLS
ncbi:1,4-dihydroxy-2-naphthoate octaprenyltransferase [Flavobacterium sediminis]|uniref:1,4-dihydroxy-2-naphthoate octaprenyltransferase n=1 Tax=Flavobacterium sediminis TaxID=2201181 RepID=A0A2U8QQU1_9FLAO|nr:1,4-dihydroxy-2-naphthoate octaprenyltransferase [Flavobacterium sediminis]AWM12423.1 1,4-dihydroxy-2-naphthoate octaprenyltransferase [Flavobacterium sediminis]